MQKGWILDHVGHAVYDLDSGIKAYQSCFGLSLEVRETLSDHLVEAAFLRCGESCIELLAPLPENKKLSKFLSARGEGLHHICFRVDSVESELKRLKSLKLPLVDEQPRQGSRGMDIAFLHPHAALGVLVEICSIKR